MKKLLWLTIPIVIGVVWWFATVACPHPEHWGDNLAYALGLAEPEEPPDFDSKAEQPVEPIDLLTSLPLFCPVHRGEMHSEVVPIRYGFPVSEPEREDFPYAARFALGGCVVSDTSPTTARIRVCSECVEAERQWALIRTAFE